MCASASDDDEVESFEECAGGSLPRFYVLMKNEEVGVYALPDWKRVDDKSKFPICCHQLETNTAYLP